MGHTLPTAASVHPAQSNPTVAKGLSSEESARRVRAWQEALSLCSVLDPDESTSTPLPTAVLQDAVSLDVCSAAGAFEALASGRAGLSGLCCLLPGSPARGLVHMCGHSDPGRPEQST